MTTKAIEARGQGIGEDEIELDKCDELPFLGLSGNPGNRINRSTTFHLPSHEQYHSMVSH